MTLVVGVDVGTTMVKAALFELADSARPRAVAEAPTPTSSSRPGWFEADPAALLDAVADGVREVVAQADGAPVDALGISATACGAWLVDADGAIVRPPILWNDGRAVDVTAGWAADGVLEEIFAISGNVPYPGYTLPLLRWLRLNEPRELDRAVAVLCPKDWLRFELTGELGTDETDASYVPFDLRARAWSPRLHELSGVVEDAARLLPEIRPPHHVAGLRASWAQRTGLAPGTPIALGLTDVVSSTIGGGAIRPGRAVTSLGTSAVSTVVVDEPSFEPAGVGLGAASPGGRWMRTMVNTSGSMTLDWAARLLCDGDVAELLHRAERAPAGADGAVLVPYLSPAGVVSPFVEPAGRATLAGLRVGHGPDEVARAAVEGLAAAVGDCYAAMPFDVENLVVVGGAGRSDLLLQTIADVVGAPVHRLEGEAFGARAAALVAARAAGLLADDDALQHAVEAVDVSRSFTPVPRAADALMRRYRAASRATRGLWDGWAGGPS